MAKKKFDPADAFGFGLDVDFVADSLRSEFSGAPPFSVLDARMAEWQDRKRAWISLGIESEMGRGKNLLKMSPDSIGVATSQEYKDAYAAAGKAKKAGNADLLFKNQERMNAIMGQRGKGALKYGANTGRDGKSVGHMKPNSSIPKGLCFNEIPDYDGRINKKLSGTSIFDPVLCELHYQWFCPTGGHILDPFAGGSVRGIVASMLDKNYTGVDLRKEQIEANYFQWGLLKAQSHGAEKPCPTWIAGDSMNIRSLAKTEEGYDYVFSCPPYGNLEVYSKESGDLSNMSHEDFISMYRQIIRRACSLLKPNRFASFVVGDFRDKDTGIYRNFTSDTIQAFIDAGLHYYNEAILVTMVGSLPIRTGAHFRKSRKLGKTHQNVFTFWKGDMANIPKTIAEEF